MPARTAVSPVRYWITAAALAIGVALTLVGVARASAGVAWTGPPLIVATLTPLCLWHIRHERAAAWAIAVDHLARGLRTAPTVPPDPHRADCIVHGADCTTTTTSTQEKRKA
ncbi:hypothetical protein ACSMX9_22770 [Streptomyces sp. LE64]|uniref:hypothetical protein n=1 Tax=Streptomyces sp. LE64 TaxID=3448653 RepID=UPI004042A431